MQIQTGADWAIKVLKEIQCPPTYHADTLGYSYCYVAGTFGNDGTMWFVETSGRR